MSDVETRDNQEQVQEWTPTDELNQLKRDMAEKIIEEYNNKQWGLLNDIFKDNIVDYLVDEWDFFYGLVLKLGIWFSGSAEELEQLRDVIKETNEKEKLSALENEVLDNLKNKWVFLERKDTSSQNAWTVDQNPGNSSYSGNTWDAIQDIDYNVPHLQSAPLWQAKEIPLSKREQRLFPNWLPKTKNEMLKYITEIKVPIYTLSSGGKVVDGGEMRLSIHKKLANEYQAVFQEMYNKHIPINPSKTWWFNWRKVRWWNSLSHHSFWSAVDVNWDVNGWAYGKTVKSSKYYNNNETIKIWENHGFNWWWNFTKYDPMHFSYMEKWKMHRVA